MYIVNIFKLDQDDAFSPAIWGGLNTLMQKMTREQFVEELMRYKVPQEQIDDLLDGSKLAVHEWTEKWTIYIQSYKL